MDGGRQVLEAQQVLCQARRREEYDVGREIHLALHRQRVRAWSARRRTQGQVRHRHLSTSTQGKLVNTFHWLTWLPEKWVRVISLGITVYDDSILRVGRRP